MGKRVESDNVVENAIQPLRQFAVDSYRLLNKCTKPDANGTSVVGVVGELEGWMQLELTMELLDGFYNDVFSSS